MSVIRRVKTPEGAIYYDLPIGSPIVPRPKVGGKFDSVEQLKSVPLGTTVQHTSLTGGNVRVFTKVKGGHWQSDTDSFTPETFAQSIQGGRVTLKAVPPKPKAEGEAQAKDGLGEDDSEGLHPGTAAGATPPVGDAVQAPGAPKPPDTGGKKAVASSQELSDAPVGTEVSYVSHIDGGKKTFQKTADGSWHKVENGQPVEGVTPLDGSLFDAAIKSGKLHYEDDAPGPGEPSPAKALENPTPAPGTSPSAEGAPPVPAASGGPAAPAAGTDVATGDNGDVPDVAAMDKLPTGAQVEVVSKDGAFKAVYTKQADGQWATDATPIPALSSQFSQFLSMGAVKQVGKPAPEKAPEKPAEPVAPEPKAPEAKPADEVAGRLDKLDKQTRSAYAAADATGKPQQTSSLLIKGNKVMFQMKVKDDGTEDQRWTVEGADTKDMAILGSLDEVQKFFDDGGFASKPGVTNTKDKAEPKPEEKPAAPAEPKAGDLLSAESPEERAGQLEALKPGARVLAKMGPKDDKGIEFTKTSDGEWHSSKGYVSGKVLAENSMSIELVETDGTPAQSVKEKGQAQLDEKQKAADDALAKVYDDNQAEADQANYEALASKNIDELYSYPTGQKLATTFPKSDGGKIEQVYTKQGDDTWKGEKGNVLSTTDLGFNLADKGAMSEPVEDKPEPAAPKPTLKQRITAKLVSGKAQPAFPSAPKAEPAAPEKLSTDQLAALKTGAKMKFVSWPGAAEQTYVKQADGSWHGDHGTFPEDTLANYLKPGYQGQAELSLLADGSDDAAPAAPKPKYDTPAKLKAMPKDSVVIFTTEAGKEIKYKKVEDGAAGAWQSQAYANAKMSYLKFADATKWKVDTVGGGQETPGQADEASKAGPSHEFDNVMTTSKLLSLPPGSVVQYENPNTSYTKKLEKGGDGQWYDEDGYVSSPEQGSFVTSPESYFLVHEGDAPGADKLATLADLGTGSTVDVKFPGLEPQLYTKSDAGSWVTGDGYAVLPETLAQHGELTVKHDSAGAPPEAVAEKVEPSLTETGGEPSHYDVGGVKATKADIQAAIDALENQKGIYVKQPLAKIGSPIANVDYKALAKEHDPGTNKTKPAFIAMLKAKIADSGKSADEAATGPTLPWQADLPAAPAAPTPGASIPTPVDGHQFSSMNELDSLPTGAKVTFPATGASYEKTAEGKWQGNGGLWETSSFTHAVANGNVAYVADAKASAADGPEGAPVASPDEGVPASAKKGYKPTTSAELNEYPPGTEIWDPGSETASGDGLFVKGAGGLWYGHSGGKIIEFPSHAFPTTDPDGPYLNDDLKNTQGMGEPVFSVAELEDMPAGSQIARKFSDGSHAMFTKKFPGGAAGKWETDFAGTGLYLDGKKYELSSDQFDDAMEQGQIRKALAPEKPKPVVKAGTYFHKDVHDAKSWKLVVNDDGSATLDYNDLSSPQNLDANVVAAMVDGWFKDGSGLMNGASNKLVPGDVLAGWSAPETDLKPVLGPMKPGIYRASPGATAFMTIHTDGTATYTSADGSEKVLQPSTALENFNAGMKTYTPPTKLVSTVNAVPGGLQPDQKFYDSDPGSNPYPGSIEIHADGQAWYVTTNEPAFKMDAGYAKEVLESWQESGSLYVPSASGYLKAGEAPEPLSANELLAGFESLFASPSKPGDKITTVAQLDMLPAGSVLDSPNYGKGYLKQADGWWKKGNSQVSEDAMASIVNDANFVMQPWVYKTGQQMDVGDLPNVPVGTTLVSSQGLTMKKLPDGTWKTEGGSTLAAGYEPTDPGKWSIHVLGKGQTWSVDDKPDGEDLPKLPTGTVLDGLGVMDGIKLKKLPDGTWEQSYNGSVKKPMPADYTSGNGYWKISALDGASEPAAPETPKAPTANPLPDNLVPYAFTGPPVGNMSHAQMSKLMDEYAKATGHAKIAGLHKGKLDKYERAQWLTYWYNGDYDKAYQLELGAAYAQGKSTHDKAAQHPGAPGNFQKKQMAAAVPGELPAGVLPTGVGPLAGFDPSTVNSAYGLTPEFIDAYMIAAGMKHSTGLSTYAKRDWVYAHLKGNKVNVDRYSLQAKQAYNAGIENSQPITPPLPSIQPGETVQHQDDWKPFNISSSHALNLTDEQVKTYVQQILSKKAAAEVNQQDPMVGKALAQLHWLASAPATKKSYLSPEDAKNKAGALLEAIEKDVAAKPTYGEWSMQLPNFGPVVKTYTKLPPAQQPSYDGFGEKFDVADDEGNVLLFKVSKEDWRPALEHAAHEVAKLFGFSPAESKVATVTDGGQDKLGQLQSKIENLGQIKNVKAEDLTDRQLADVLRLHALDYAIDNDDGHHGNFLLLPNGGVAGIDMGRAWKHMGTSGKGLRLEVGNMSSNADVYYDRVFKAIQAGKIDPERVQKAYLAAMKSAKRISATDDEAFLDVIHDAFQNMPLSAAQKTKRAQDALARKNATHADMEKFWDGVLAKAGIEKPQPSKQLAKGVHTTISPEFIEDVAAGGQHGHALVLGGEHLEDGHVMYWNETTTGGAQRLNAQGQLTKSGDATFHKWLKDNAGDIVTVDAPKNDDTLSGHDELHNNVLAGVKTISHYVQQEGQGYNASKLAQMASAKADIAAQLSKFDSDAAYGEKLYPGKPKKAASHKAMLAHYLKVIQGAEAAKAASEKPGVFAKYEYVPVPEDSAIDPPVAKAKAAFKVTKRAAINHMAVPNYSGSGELHEQNKTETEGHSLGGYGASGEEYVITFDDGTEITYQPWSGLKVTKAQQGTVKFRGVPGSSDTAQAERFAALLRQAGLDAAEEADETDLELQYWRQLYGTLQNRKDRTENGQGKVLDRVANDNPAKYKGNRSAELAAWRTAWGELKGKEAVDDWVAKRGYLPRFSKVSVANGNTGTGHGRPSWMRFDADLKKLRAGSLVHTSLTYGNGPDVIMLTAQSGTLLSTEERLRVLGRWLPGGSSKGDQTSHGSSHFVYTRHSGDTSSNVYFDPAIMARTSTANYNYDAWGDVDAKKSASNWSTATGGVSHSTETVFKNNISILDEVVVFVMNSQADRDAIIKYYKDRGITTGHGGAPLSDIFVTSSEKASALTKAKARLKAMGDAELAPLQDA